MFYIDINIYRITVCISIDIAKRPFAFGPRNLSSKTQCTTAIPDPGNKEHQAAFARKRAPDTSDSSILDLHGIAGVKA